MDQITSGLRKLILAGIGAAAAVVMMAVPAVVFIVSQSNVLETMATSGMKD